MRRESHRGLYLWALADLCPGKVNRGRCAYFVVCVNYACVHGWSFIRGHAKVDKYLSAWNIPAESPCPVVLPVRLGCVPKRCSTCAWVMCHGWRDRARSAIPKNNSIVSVTWNSQGGKSCTCETGIKLWRGSLVTEQRAERPMVVLATPLIWNHITQSLARPFWGHHLLLCSRCTFWKVLETSRTDGTVVVALQAVVVALVVVVLVVVVVVMVQQLRSYMPQTDWV